MTSESAGPEVKSVIPGEALLAEFKVQVVKGLCLNGVKMDSAITIGQEIVEYLLHHWGGEAIYMPKKRAATISARNALICAEFQQGASKAELAVKHNVSDNSIRDIVREPGKATRMTPGDEFLICLEEQTSLRIFVAGVNQKTAEAIGLKVAEHLAHHFNSLTFYIPKLAFKASGERHQNIYREHKEGLTHRELAAKHNLCVRQVYTILRKVRIHRKEAGNKAGRPPRKVGS